MADHCQICDTRRPHNGTKVLIMKNSPVKWVEFCDPCGLESELENSETGEKITLLALWERNDEKSND